MSFRSILVGLLSAGMIVGCGSGDSGGDSGSGTSAVTQAERAEVFASRVSGGVYTYRYTARATTPGKFIVPPAKAEEMYHPETFGRSASARVTVIDDAATRQPE